MGSMLWGLPTLSSRTRHWRLLAPLVCAPWHDNRRSVCVCLPCQVEIMHMRHKLDTDTKLIRWGRGTGVRWLAGWLAALRTAWHCIAHCWLFFAPWLVAPVKRSLCASPTALVADMLACHAGAVPCCAVQGVGAGSWLAPPRHAEAPGELPCAQLQHLAGVREERGARCAVLCRAVPSCCAGPFCVR